MCRDRDRMVVVSSNPARGEIYSIKYYVINFISDLRQISGFLFKTPLLTFRACKLTKNTYILAETIYI
jgi:hypothetical protein